MSKALMSRAASAGPARVLVEWMTWLTPGDAHELGLRGQQGNGRLHRGNVEGAAQGAKGQKDVDVGDPDLAEGEQRGHDGGAGGDEDVGRDHDPLPVPAVDEDSREGAQEEMGQEHRDVGKGQDLGRPRLDAQPENDGVADDGTAQGGEELSGPDDDEGSFPGVHGISYEFATGPVTISGRSPHVKAVGVRVACSVSFCA